MNTWRRLPMRLLVNAISVPSGDQAGSVSSPGLCITQSKPVPSALIIMMSRPRSFPKSSAPPSVTYSNLAPSGDHLGCALSPGPKVSWRGSLPSAFIVHICRIPSVRSLTKAIRPPPPNGTGVMVGVRVGVGERLGMRVIVRVAVGGGVVGVVVCVVVGVSLGCRATAIGSVDVGVAGRIEMGKSTFSASATPLTITIRTSAPRPNSEPRRLERSRERSKVSPNEVLAVTSPLGRVCGMISSNAVAGINWLWSAALKFLISGKRSS